MHINRRLLAILIVVLFLAGLVLLSHAETLTQQNTAINDFSEYAYDHALSFYLGRTAVNKPWTARLNTSKHEWQAIGTQGETVESVTHRVEADYEHFLAGQK